MGHELEDELVSWDWDWVGVGLQWDWDYDGDGIRIVVQDGGWAAAPTPQKRPISPQLWVQERLPLASQQDVGSDLQSVQLQLKKNQVGLGLGLGWDWD